MWGASEVYVDGHRGAASATSRRNAEEERTRDPRGRAVALPLVPGQVHHIAVRVSSWPLADGTRAGRWFATAGFRAGFRAGRSRQTSRPMRATASMPATSRS